MDQSSIRYAMKLSGTISFKSKPKKVQRCLDCCGQLLSIDLVTCAGS